MSSIFDLKFFWQVFVTLVIMDPPWLTMRFSGVIHRARSGLLSPADEQKGRA